MKPYPLFFSLLFLLGCKSTGTLSTANTKTDQHSIQHRNGPPVTTSFYDADTSVVIDTAFLDTLHAVSLFGLPQTATGAYQLTPGFYEGAFKSYCLHPGTQGPAFGDGYVYAPLKGARKDIVESILQVSAIEGIVSQRDVQLLLWAVLAKTAFRNLSPNLKQAAVALLTPRQLYELNGGAVGLVPDVARALTGRVPAALQTALALESQLQHLFTSSNAAYEDFERLAVLPEADGTSRPEFKRGSGAAIHPGIISGFPKGYQRTTIQVYLPASNKKTPVEDTISQPCLIYPFDMVAVPANSKAQRLGIGGPWGAPDRDVFQYPIPRVPQPRPLPRQRKAKTPAPEIPPASKDGRTKT